MEPVQYIKRHHHHHHHHEEEHQDLNKIPGIAGHDYPVFHEVPPTSFHCSDVPGNITLFNITLYIYIMEFIFFSIALPGMYANVETGCQAYHVCHDGREGHQGAAFLCTNGTIFNQEKFTCDWWYNVDCNQATSHYNLNADPEHNPYFPKKKAEHSFA